MKSDALAGNISNIDTPAYQAKDIDFNAALDQAMESEKALSLSKTDPRHMDLGTGGAVSGEIFDVKGNWNGFNRVDIDREITKLTENNLIYRSAVESLLRKVNLLKEVIREGGK